MSRVPERASVFISSTCYDLLDVRAELREHLIDRGLDVRLSDHPDSAFRVDGRVDSIEACLQNVETSDVVVCVLDRRAGPPLKGSYGDHTATELEVRRALDRGKPVLLFVRDTTLNELDVVGRPLNTPPGRGVDGLVRRVRKALGGRAVPPTRWIASDDDARRLHKIVSIVTRTPWTPPVRSGSNWRDPFATSFDLRRRVLKRVLEALPPSKRILAAAPNLPRVVISSSAWSTTQQATIVNVGPGAALDVTCRLLLNGKPVPDGRAIARAAALLEGAQMQWTLPAVASVPSEASATFDGEATYRSTGSQFGRTRVRVRPVFDASPGGSVWDVNPSQEWSFREGDDDWLILQSW